VPLDEGGQGGERLALLFLRRVRVDCRGIEHLARRIDHNDFAAGAEARVETEHDMPGQRRLREQSA
jgi:hypothetical protein